MKPIVIIENLASDEASLKAQFTRSFSSLSFVDAFVSSKAVFIKPNLTYPTYKKGVVTQKEFVESLIGALREINNTTKIYVGEGEGGYNSFSMSDAIKDMGFYEITEAYLNVIS